MSKFDDCAEKIDHLEKPVAMALIFEWVKTGHINKAEFTGLIGRLHQTEPAPTVSAGADKPIHLNGPFAMKYEQGHWVIRGADGVPLTELTGQLIDGSGRKDRYPDGVIRSRSAREEEAKFVLRAMNLALSGHRLFGEPRQSVATALSIRGLA